MHLPHPWGIAGLVMSGLSAIGLLIFSANPLAGSALTYEQMMTVWHNQPELRRDFARKVWGYRLSLVALALGFFLQLIDLLTS
jgi:hypothetical protein